MGSRHRLTLDVTLSKFRVALVLHGKLIKIEGLTVQNG